MFSRLILIEVSPFLDSQFSFTRPLIGEVPARESFGYSRIVGFAYAYLVAGTTFSRLLADSCHENLDITTNSNSIQQRTACNNRINSPLIVYTK